MATDSKTLPDIPNAPGQNWIDRVHGNLPPLVKRVVKHLVSERGYTQSRAVPTAINWCKKMCATGTAFGGKVHVSGVAQGAACAAVAQWEALKAKAHLSEEDLPKPYTMSWADIYSLVESAQIRLELLEEAMGEDNLATLVLQEGGVEGSLGELALIEMTIAEAYPRTRLGRKRDGKFQNLMKRLSEGGMVDCPNCGKKKSKDGTCLYCAGKVEEAGFGAPGMFDGSKHPRGKPKNRGQFAPKGGASGTAQAGPAGSSRNVGTAVTAQGVTVQRDQHQSVKDARSELRHAKSGQSSNYEIQAARARLGAEVAQREKRLARLGGAPPGLKAGDPDPRHHDDMEAWNSQGNHHRETAMRSFIDAGGELDPGKKFHEDGSIITRTTHPGAFSGHGGSRGHPDGAPATKREGITAGPKTPRPSSTPKPPKPPPPPGTTTSILAIGRKKR